MRTQSPAARFILKSFADLQPVDFNDYIDDRCQYVSGSTVDRELDLLAATCNLAIKTWRIPVVQNPMDGVKRPSYFNERDRRLMDGRTNTKFRYGIPFTCLPDCSHQDDTDTH